MTDIFTPLRAHIGALPVTVPIGRIIGISRGTIRVRGLEKLARQGDRVSIGALGGEVLQLSPDELVVLTDGPAEGLSIGAPVELIGTAEIAPDNSWIGRIIDPYGRSLDGRALFRGPQARPGR